MSSNFIIAVLEDYCQLQLDGAVDLAGRYKVSDVSVAINSLVADTITVIAKGRMKATTVYTLQVQGESVIVLVDSNNYHIGDCHFYIDTYTYLERVKNQVPMSLVQRYQNVVEQLREYIKEQKRV